MTRQAIATAAAPSALGAYSQAIRAGDTVYLSGQIPLDPTSMELVSGTREQIHQVFRNLRAVANAAGGDLGDVVKLNVYLTDLTDFPLVNEVMADQRGHGRVLRRALSGPGRGGVASLPKDAVVEIEGVLVKSV